MKIDEALQGWKRNTSQSFEACEVMNDSLRLLDIDSFDLTLSSDVSLVLHDKCSQDAVDVSFVSWIKPRKKLEGRIVNLDDDACIIYPSHFHSTKLTFTGAIIIVPCTGARVAKQSRERIPIAVRRLRQMFSSAVTAFVELGFVDADTDIGDGQLLVQQVDWTTHVGQSAGVVCVGAVGMRSVPTKFLNMSTVSKRHMGFRHMHVCMLCVCYAYVMCILCVCYVYVMCMFCVWSVYVLCTICLCYVYVMCMICVCYVCVSCMLCVCYVYGM